MAKLARVALLGSKFMGRTHSNAYLKAAKFFDLPVEPVMELICARHAGELEAFARRWGWKRWTTDWQKAVADERVELVDVGTPNHVHKEQAIAALEAGKHVACEKPLAGTLGDAREMLEAAKRARKSKTFVWYNYRRCPAVALAHQLVKEGRLGRIYHVRAAYLQDWGGPDTPLLWRFQEKYAGTGPHGDLNAHSIDMARFITGQEITEVIGAHGQTFIKERDIIDDAGGEIAGRGAKRSGRKKGRSTVEDAMIFIAKMSGGAIASFDTSRLSTGDKNRNRIEIHGEKGALRFNFERMNELEWYDATIEPRLQGWSAINVTRGGDGHPYAGAWWPASHVIGYEHGFVNMASDIFRVLGGQKAVVPLPDFADAYQTQRVLQAALESAKNRAPVPMSEVR